MYLQLGNLTIAQLKQAYENAGHRLTAGSRFVSINSVHPEDVTGQVWWYEVDTIDAEINGGYSCTSRFKVSFDTKRLMIVGKFVD